MPKFQKAPLFSVFALSAISKNHGASVGQKAPFLREIARSGHIGLENQINMPTLLLFLHFAQW